MSGPKNGEKVRLTKGRTVDTAHVCGGDLAGLDATVVSEVYESDGKDGAPKGQRRVALGVNDERAPRGAGIITAPVENIEPRSAVKRFFGGIGVGPGKWMRDGSRKTFVYDKKQGRLVEA